MKNLVRVAIIAIALSISFAANARQGQAAAGAGLFIGGSSHAYFGPSVKFQYNITNPIRLGGSFAWSFPRSSVNMWGANVNAHYLFPMHRTPFTLYPLVGLGWVGYRTNADLDPARWNTNRFGLNVGGGIDLSLTHRLVLNFEVRHKFIANLENPYFIGAGVAFIF